jgi:hypothetical protein
MNRPGLQHVFCAFLGGLLSLSLWGATGDGPAAKFKGIEATIQNQELDVTIELEGPFHYQIINPEPSSRLILECSPVEEFMAPVSKEIGAFHVERVSLVQWGQDRVRIIFEFSKEMPLYLVSQTKIGLQVVFLSQEMLPAKSVKPASPSQPVTPPPFRDPTTFLGLNLVNSILSDERFKTVFLSQIATSWGLEFSQVFLKSGRSDLALGLEYRNLYFHGQSTVTGQETSVTITPLPLSLSYLVRSSKVAAFISAGPVFINYREKSTLQNTFGYTTGFRFQGGIFLGTPTFKTLKAKFYLSWTYALAEENGIRVNLGGLEIGAGLALAFSLF